jgi:transposase
MRDLMSVRLLLTEEAWAEIAPILTTLQSRAGSPPARSARLCIEAVLYLARTGIPWRDLPKELGHWDAVYNRLRRWERRGIWRRRWERRHGEEGPLTRPLFIEAPIVRAPQQAAGALKKNGGPTAQALGRSRGGWSTTIPAGCRDEHTGVAIVLTAGHGQESPVFETGLAPVPPEPPLPQAMMDKGYASNDIREPLLAQAIVPVLPSKSHRTAAIAYDHDL